MATGTTQQRARNKRTRSASGKANSLKAVERLIEARKRYPQETADERQGESMAFKLALPELKSRADIKDFIAAVAQGIALGFFNGREGSQLLYAAQIAMSANTDEKKRK